MTCQHAPAGCNDPQSECLGLCLHRIDAEAMSKDCAVIFGTAPLINYARGAENEGRIARCKRAYLTHRFVGRFAAIRQAFKAWRAK